MRCAQCPVAQTKVDIVVRAATREQSVFVQRLFGSVMAFVPTTSPACLFVRRRRVRDDHHVLFGWLVSGRLGCSVGPRRHALSRDRALFAYNKEVSMTLPAQAM